MGKLPAFIPPSGKLNTATEEWVEITSTIPVIEAEPDPTEHIITATITPPGEPAPAPATPIPTPNGSFPLLYYTQAGDTLPVVAVRFGVMPGEVISPDPIPETGFINPNQLLIIPNRLSNTTSPAHLLPDSELVYSPSSKDFDTVGYVEHAGGYLDSYEEYLGSTGSTKGSELVSRFALDNSINPRLLLALIEYQSGWINGQPNNQEQVDYPMGKRDPAEKDLLRQLKWAVNTLSLGYYDWREGRLTGIVFTDGVSARLAPDLNAGTAALQFYFSQILDSMAWWEALNSETGFIALYKRMFGNPWVRAQETEPLFPPDLEQPNLKLPFTINSLWSYTGGPHGAWERDGSWAAIDFAPGSLESGCVKSDAWVVASSGGVVVRSERGIIVLDLDGDGYEQTGWVLIILHIATESRIPAGEYVMTGDLLGHPSCEGGRATGTHIHIARKYNGEWLTADGPIPFILSGWRVHAGSEPYKGTLTRDGETITANQFGAFQSRIVRLATDP